MLDDLENEFTVSSRKRRIAAFVIDHFILTFLMVSIFFLYLGPNYMDEDQTSKLKTALFAIMLPGFLLYFVKDAVKGISAGKWIMGIMVRDEKRPSQIPSFGRLLLRNLLILIWPIEFIVLALNQQKKRLGDKIANTIVVKNANKPGRMPRFIALISIGLAFFAFSLIFVGTAMKSSDAYKVAIYEIEQNSEIVYETGGIKGYGIMPSGSVNITNGYGQAQLQIKVKGNEKNMHVSVYLTKEPNGGWQLIRMRK